MAILLTASMSALEVKRASSELKVNVSFDPKRIQYHAVVLTNQLVPRVIKYRIDERRALRETVVTLCDGETVHLSQNKHPDLLGYCREENQSASLTQAAFSCGSRFGTQKVQYAKA
jgi:predicted NAD/FAD-binding protein